MLYTRQHKFVLNLNKSVSLNSREYLKFIVVFIEPKVVVYLSSISWLHRYNYSQITLYPYLLLPYHLP